MPKLKPKSDTRQLLNRINERFPNFLLGLTVFVLVLLIGSLFLQSKELASIKLPQTINKILGRNNDAATAQPVPKSYTVKKGDTLWSIAEEAYGSGYNAYDLAKVNKIENANMLNEGVKVLLPPMEPKDPTRGELASGVFTTHEESPQITQQQPQTKTYKILAGDSLWLISMKVYGNPYRWTELWKQNPSIANPDLIYAGNSLDLM